VVLPDSPLKFRTLWIFLFSTLLVCAQVTTTTFKWGTHIGPSSPTPDFYDYILGSDPTVNFLYQLSADGASTSKLDDTTGAATYNGDLVELGFFDTDGTNDSSYTPNTSTTNMFQGLWTPLTSKTTIGQDWYSSTDIADGLFFFETSFNENNGALDDDAVSNSEADSGYNISTDSPSGLADRVVALNDATNPLIGIRFYDGSSPSSGSTRYNTIMSSGWMWDSSQKLLTDSGLTFEFDNTDAYTANISKVGTGDNQLANDDFVATITYHDGTSAFNASSSSHILSALSGSGAVTIGNDHTLTVNSNSGVETSFSGDISASGSAGASTFIKTGSGKQTLTGSLELAGTNSGWLNVNSGTLSLAGSSKDYEFEYLTGTGGALELNTTDTVTLGFANTSNSQSFDGNLSLVAAGTVSIEVASGTAAADYSKEQNVSGVISGSVKISKGGVGRLVVENDNSGSKSGGAQITNGTLAIGNSADDASLGTGTIEIQKGKLEVLSGDSVSNVVQGTSASDKSMVGGDGTISSVTVGGDTAEITVVSPGQGISSSLSSETSTQQVSLGTGGSSALAMGDFTITSLTLNDGGVYDWEISDFSDSGVAGTDFDVLKFTNLTFDSSGTFTLNILGLQSDGTAGSVAGSDGSHNAGYQNLWDDSWNNSSTKTGGYNGFKFLDGSSHGNITWGGVTSGGSAPTASGGYIDNFFSVNQDGFAYHNNFWMGDWNVWYDGSGDFYLRYSVAPEPSTYVMVTGLMLVPGMGAVRKYRNRKKKDSAEELAHKT